MWFGADPGGQNKFGVAILHDDGAFKTFCVSCADEAYEKLPPDARGRSIPIRDGDGQEPRSAST